jgi:Fe-S-cluster containining protein
MSGVSPRSRCPNYLFTIAGFGSTKRIAGWLEIPLYAFRRRFMVKDLDGAPSLRIRSSGDCVFWKDGCTIYSVRPRQCRTFPFWPENLESPQTWKAVQATCHGAGKGRLYKLEEIRSVVHGRATGPSVASEASPARSSRK